jgi:hypothetical protein
MTNANLEQYAPFEVHEPSGHVYRVWLDGRVEGFAPGAMVVNGIAPSYDYAASLLMLAAQHRRVVADEQLAHVLDGGLGAGNDMRRLLTIQIENATMGDGFFMPEVIKVLRSYANAMDAGLAGRESPERHEIEGGTVLTATASSWCEAQERPQGPLWLRLPDGSLMPDDE